MLNYHGQDNLMQILVKSIGFRAGSLIHAVEQDHQFHLINPVESELYNQVLPQLRMSRMLHDVICRAPYH